MSYAGLGDIVFASLLFNTVDSRYLDSGYLE